MMKQKPSQRLQTVLKLAQIKEQQAAGQLADSIRNLSAQQQQEQQFTIYKREYSEQFKHVGSESGSERISASQLANYQRFYGSLEAAGNTQHEQVELASQQQEQARTQWQQQHSRQKNMGKLVDQKRQQEESEIEKKLQREQDDRVTYVWGDQLESRK
ncbi:MAG: flagellar export protein FliJ [Oceanicoccus sp.]|uniref:flagellar export protein FliJ n=1 Tax=Oceanicoccus sp. TaxID=2691044 RepID=UPI00262A28FF|nr:flagellar export protein FliJ [Oceanicoccus sp.]MCP3908116.1 flagellar export protein FliJ [Oceanicoccus sp.]